MRKKMIMLGLCMVTSFGLSGCNENEGVDSRIIEQLKTPCKGEISSSFYKTDAGWTLNVSCSDKKKIEQQRKRLREGLEEKVEPRSDGYNPLSYE